jgi:hypothetical protein
MENITHHLFKADQEHLDQINESVLLGASELARDHSIETIRIEDVVVRSQVSRSTIHKLFITVDGLYKRLAQKLMNEMAEHFLHHLPQSPDIAIRVATKTKLALLVADKLPFLSRLLLKAEWPSTHHDHLLYRDIEKDIEEGIRLGCFSNIPPSIGVNIIIGSLRGAIEEILQKKQSAEYANQVVYQILISLGVNQENASLISKASAPAIPPLPSGGLTSKVVSLESLGPPADFMRG